VDTNQNDKIFEEQRLKETLTQATKQLTEAREKNDNNRQAIMDAKQEIRENTSHSISNLWGSEGFEALVELSQALNPVNEKMAQFEAVEKTIKKLEKAIRSPYFARIDFYFNDGGMTEKIYIGRNSIRKEDSYQMLVYDWRSPVASVFYRFVPGLAFYDAPVGRIEGELTLKRQYEIKNGVLKYYFDADVQIVDEFLRALLSQNASSSMKAIVESIQKDQDQVIRDLKSEVLMVQGVAGSGKTSIALHRAAYLMYQGLSDRLEAHNILIISPNKLFERYIGKVIPELGEESVMTQVFDEILTDCLNNRRVETRNHFLSEVLSEGGGEVPLETGLAFKTSVTFKEILDRLIADIPRRWMTIEDFSDKHEMIISKAEMIERLQKSPSLPLKVKLRYLEEYVDETLYYRRNRRLLNHERKKLPSLKDISLMAIYRELFRDQYYFFSLANGLKLPDNIKAVIRHAHEQLYLSYLSYDDASALAYLNLKVYGSEDNKGIKQVILDEAQDYYPLHYEVLNLLFPKARFTILGDINQTLKKSEDLSFYDQIRVILNRKNSSLLTMNKSFRCTREILEFSRRFISRELQIESFNRNGDEPEVKIARDQKELTGLIIDEVRFCKDQGYESVGLIVKNSENAQRLYQSLKEELQITLVKDETIDGLVGNFVIPVYLSKGLEFDAVIIADGNDQNYHTENDKRLLYISCTRALHRLSILGLGQMSPLLQKCPGNS
jgi:DNA helicase-2/ATP-dependent DNA helicase PcrA